MKLHPGVLMRWWKGGLIVLVSLLVLVALPLSRAVTAQSPLGTVRVDTLAPDGQLLRTVTPGATIRTAIEIHWWGKNTPAPVMEASLPPGLTNAEVTLMEWAQCVTDTHAARCTLTLPAPGIALVELRTRVAADLQPGTVLTTTVTLTVQGKSQAQDAAILRVVAGSAPLGSTSTSTSQPRTPTPSPVRRAPAPVQHRSVIPPTATPIGGAVTTPVSLGPAPTPTMERLPAPPTPIALRSTSSAVVQGTVIVAANVRNMPHLTGSQVLAVAPAGTVVTVEAQVPDHTWFRVLTPEGVRGWMFHALLNIAPALLAQVAPATGDLMVGGMSMTATSVAAVPEMTGMPQANGVVVTEMPVDISSQIDDGIAPAQALIAVPLMMHVCYDRNQNHACDIDEGIAGVTMYVTDAHSGRLLGQALTDVAGLAQLMVRAPAQGQLVASVPDFAWSQTTGVTNPLFQPVIIKELAPVPALLP